MQKCVTVIMVRENGTLCTQARQLPLKLNANFKPIHHLKKKLLTLSLAILEQ